MLSDGPPGDIEPIFASPPLNVITFTLRLHILTRFDTDPGQIHKRELDHLSRMFRRRREARKPIEGSEKNAGTEVSASVQSTYGSAHKSD